MLEHAFHQDHFGAPQHFGERKTSNLRGGCKEFRLLKKTHIIRIPGSAHLPRNHFGVKVSACRLTYAKFLPKDMIAACH